MISLTAEYALRAIVFFGNQRGEAATTARVSEATNAPSSYLAKVLKGLRRAGIVSSQRGLHGGYTLTREPEDLTILDVVTAVDARQRIENCPLGRPAHTSGLCPLHRRMDHVMAAAEESYGETTIGELLEEPGLLCSLPCISEPVVSLAGHFPE